MCCDQSVDRQRAADAVTWSLFLTTLYIIITRALCSREIDQDHRIFKHKMPLLFEFPSAFSIKMLYFLPVVAEGCRLHKSRSWESNYRVRRVYFIKIISILLILNNQRFIGFLLTEKYLNELMYIGTMLTIRQLEVKKD